MLALQVRRYLLEEFGYAEKLGLHASNILSNESLSAYAKEHMKSIRSATSFEAVIGQLWAEERHDEVRRITEHLVQWSLRGYWEELQEAKTIRKKYNEPLPNPVLQHYGNNADHKIAP